MKRATASTGSSLNPNKLLPIFLICLAFFFSAADVRADPRNIRSCLLMNLSTGQILYQKNQNQQVAPASLTKIMTMFLALDAIKAGKLSINQKVPVTAEAAKIGGSAMRISAGERVPVVRLLAGMAVASGNDAAMAIALKLGGSAAGFAKMMNAKARQLGMTRTVFKNPTGLPAPGQKTTAHDLMLLCKAYLKAYPQARRFHSMKFFMHKGMVIRNTNPFLGTLNGVDGLKTGWTVASGYNLIVTAKRGKNRLLAIVLGGTSKQARDKASLQLLEAGFNNPRNPKAVAKALSAK